TVGWRTPTTTVQTVTAVSLAVSAAVVTVMYFSLRSSLFQPEQAALLFGLCQTLAATPAALLGTLGLATPLLSSGLSFMSAVSDSEELLQKMVPQATDQAPGIDAVLRADRELWIRVADEVGSEFVGPGKTSVVDDAIKKWQHSMQVAFFLVPVPKPEKPEKQPLKRTWEQTSTAPYVDKGGKGNRKDKFMTQAWQTGKFGKGKAKTGKDKQQTAVPAALKGLDPNFQGVPSLTLDLSKPLSQKLILDLVRGSTQGQARHSPCAVHCTQMDCQVISACQELDVYWSLENPESSLFWLTSPISQLWRAFRSQIFHGTFDSCVYGGLRKKATTFWSNCQSVTDLALRCHPSLGHKHLSWGRLASGWSTAEEAAYPTVLCKHWASLVTEALYRKGCIADFGSAQGSVRYAAAERAALGLFPKATYAPVMVDPFQGQSWVKLESAKDRMKFVPGMRLQDPAFPKGSTTIKVMVEHGAWGALVGQPVSPEVLVQRAVQSKHPQTSLPPLPAALERTVALLADNNLPEIHRIRCQRLKTLCDIATELQPREDKDHASFAPHLKGILRGKHIRLFECLLQGLNFPDKSLPQDMRQGFKLTGWLPDTHTRPSKVVPPAMHRDEVWSQRQQNNSAIWSQCKSSGDEALDSALWQQTLEECEAGWAVLEPGHVQAPSGCVLGRRFAVKQGAKVRPIDDLSVSLVNSTLGVDEKVVVQPAASTISLALHLQRRCLSPTSRPRVPSGLRGRTFDLKWAFKQLGVCESDLLFTKVAVYNPDTGRPAVVALKALPFGATGSVHGFCRCSLALWHIAVSLLLLPLTVFFDDYTAVTLEQDCQSLTQSFLLLLKLLGWQAALTGTKATDFAESFVSLGIAYILPRTPGGFVRVCNTDSRKREVATTCLRALQSDSLSPAEALAFAGRLRQLTALVRDALNWILENIPKAEPRAFKVPATEAVQVFTDGSFEQGVGRLGGVLCRLDGTVSDWFQATVPTDVVQAWSLEGTQHPILQCELLALCVAAAVWGKQLSDLPVTWWIDNDAARHCLIRLTLGSPEYQASATQQMLQVEVTAQPTFFRKLGMSAALQSFFWNSLLQSHLSLPWEDPAFQFVAQDSTFLDDLQDKLLSLPDPVPLPQPSVQSGQGSAPQATLPAPKLRSLGSWKPQDSQAERQAALSKWSQLFRAVPHLFKSETVSEVVHECSRAELGNLDLRFAKKSTNTLLNRVSSLQRFAAWLVRSFPHEPLGESLVFLYCQHVTSQSSGSSVPDQLSQALNFADGCLGLQVAAAELLSPRVQGLAHKAMRQQKPPRQAPALTTDQVRWLQTFANSDEPQYECYVAATLLFMVYARARHSDLRRSQQLLVDTDETGNPVFVECSVLNPEQTKSSTEHVPAVRKVLGSVAVAVWKMTLFYQTLQPMSSQGLKATCLSWTMKAGIPDPDQTPQTVAVSLAGYQDLVFAALATDVGMSALFAVRFRLRLVVYFSPTFGKEKVSSAENAYWLLRENVLVLVNARKMRYADERTADPVTAPATPRKELTQEDSTAYMASLIDYRKAPVAVQLGLDKAMETEWQKYVEFNAVVPCSREEMTELTQA
ncbi:URC1, partial [Symbiodinium sp. KB8]